MRAWWSRSVFSTCATVAPGDMGTNLLHGDSGDCECRRWVIFRRTVSPTAGLGWVFSVCCVCVFPLFLQLQSAFVLLNFYWNICWLVVRLAKFFFRVCVIVKRGSNIVLVRFVLCLDSWFLSWILLA